MEGLTTAGAVAETVSETLIEFIRPHAVTVTVSFLFTLITLCAFVFNAGVIAVILKTPHLRGHLTYLFMLNLCIVDLLNSVVVLPINIVSYVKDGWSAGDSECKAFAFVSALFMYVSIFSATVISIERYYSIRAPMHYAAHMTLYVVLAVGGCLWVKAILIAASPLLGWNGYQYNDLNFHCSFAVAQENGDHSYVIFLFTLCFLAPAVIIISMYISIYKVAKRTSVQVHPVTNHLKPDMESMLVSTSTSNPSVSWTSSSRSGNLDVTPLPRFYQAPPFPHTSTNPAAGKGKIATIDGESIGPTVPSVQIRLDGVCTPTPSSPSPPSHQDLLSSQAEEGHKRCSNSHWKAAKTLTCITATFVALWGPYFTYNLSVAVGYGEQVSPILSPVFLWLGYTSYAINPVIYGLLNRSIREALYNALDQMRSALTRSPDEAPELGVDEDFFQFLERTSTAPMSPQPKPSRHLGSCALVDEAESGFESSAFT